MALPSNLVRLLESLRRAWPGGRTVEDLGRELNMQPWRVAELAGRCEHLAIPVETAAPLLRLDPAQTPLLGELIELGLETGRVGRSVVVFTRAASTNDVAWQAARRRDSDGLVVLAETQTAGRGRLGRAWFDRPGASLLFSVLLLDMPRVEGLANLLVMSASVALAEAVGDAAGLSPLIRWPNDLYLHSRKMAGILLESRGQDVVLGVGINCNQQIEDFPPELRATAMSLADELGSRVDRIALMRAALTRLDRWLGAWHGRLATASLRPAREHGQETPAAEHLHAEYVRRMDHQARRVRVHHDGASVEATVRDVDPANGLIVELPGGGVACFKPSNATVEWLA